MRHGTLLLALILAGSWRGAEPLRKPELPRIPFDAARASELRKEWAKAYGVEEEYTNSLGMKLVLIPGGRFEMGPNGSKHRVTLRKPFFIGTTEVTLGQ